MLLARGERLVADRGRELCRERRRNAGLACVNPADTFDQLLARCILEQVPFGPRFDRARDILFHIERRQYDDPGQCIDFANFDHGADAIEIRHAQIEQGHIGAQLAPDVDHLAAVGARADDDHVRLSPDDRREPLPHGHMIVGNQNTDLPRDWRAACHAGWAHGPSPRAVGRAIFTAVPCPAAVRTSSVPPIAPSLSWMPSRP